MAAPFYALLPLRQTISVILVVRQRFPSGRKTLLTTSVASRITPFIWLEPEGTDVSSAPAIILLILVVAIVYVPSARVLLVPLIPILNVSIASFYPGFPIATAMFSCTRSFSSRA